MVLFFLTYFIQSVCSTILEFQVWLDEYKQYLYQSNPTRFEKVDPGDLTKAKQIRKNLNCKPFSYFLEFVMPDQVERYSYKERGVFAYGAIQSDVDEAMCVDMDGKNPGQTLALGICSKNLTHPMFSQDFVLSWHRQIKLNDKGDECIDSVGIALFGCHYSFGNQMWFYNTVSYQATTRAIIKTNFTTSDNSPSR